LGGCFEFKVLPVELDSQCAGNLIIPPGPQFQITKHLNLDLLAQGANFFHGCLEFEALKVELEPQRVGDLRIPPRPQFQTNKHLNLVDLAQRAKKFRR
jgi:hypothetical protein